MVERWRKWMMVAAVCCVGLGGCCGDRIYRGNCDPMLLSGRGDAGGCADGSCGGGCASGRCGGGACTSCCPRPLRAFWNMITCSSGCGEFYFNEWVNDPPDRCDPCDEHGCYVGPRQACRPNLTLSARMGNCTCGHDCGGGCASGACGCGQPGCAGCQGEAMPGGEEMISPEAMEPTPARTATRPDKAYYTPQPKVTAQRRPTATAKPRTMRVSHEASVPRPAAGREVRPAAR